MAANLSPAECSYTADARGRLETFGDYEILEEVARGGMGVIYKARQYSLNRIVALKMLLPGTLDSPESLHRFRVEAEAAASLCHPNIVAIHAFGEHDGQPFYAMEYVAGADLAQVSRGHPLPARAAARYTRAVAEAVQYAHEHGVVHRDLKPSNILIDSDDQPRIADFGLAKRQAGDSDMTQTGQTLGSPHYMAPEQAAGGAGRGGRAGDVYALGAVLYHLLTGRPPFLGETPAVTLRLVIETAPVAVRLLNPSVSRDLETICLKCLEKDPSRRFASAQELADELGRWLAGEPIRTRSIGRWGRLWRWSRRKPQQAALSAAVSVLGLALLVGAPVALWRISRERNQAQRHAAEEERQRRLADATLYRLEIQRAQELFANDKAGEAIALLAFLLRGEPKDQAVAEWLLNELTYRNFALPLQTPCLHEDMVFDVQWSPDGRRLLTVSRECQVRVWDAATGDRVGSPIVHDHRQVTSGHFLTRPHPLVASFSPDGTRVVTASVDRTARVWEAETGAPLTPPLAHPDWVTVAGYTPDGRRVVTGCKDGVVRFWDAASGQPTGLTVRHGAEVVDLDVSVDGRRLVTASEDQTGQVWDAETGQPVGQALRHTKGLRCVRFDRTGSRVVTGSLDYTARVWDAATGQPLTPSLEHEGVLNTAQFSPDGVWIVTAAFDKTARVWEAATGRPVGRPLAHRATVRWAGFSPEGSRLATASEDGTARLWETQTTQPLSEPLRHSGTVWCARFSPDGVRLATASSDRTAQQWDVRPGNPPPALASYGVKLESVQWHRDGGCVLTFGQSWAFTRTVRDGSFLVDANTQRFPSTATVRSAEFSPDGQFILTAGEDGIARLRDGSGRRFLRPPMAHRGPVWRARFSPDGRHVVTASADRTARVWDLQSGGAGAAPLEHPDVVRDAVFSADGLRVATACADRQARVWDRQTAQLLVPPFPHDAEVLAVEFSPDGQWLATSAADQAARIWEAHSGRLRAVLRHDGPILAIQFSPEGRSLATASGDATARLWEVATGRPLTDPLEHDGAVTAVHFSGDGVRLVTASADGLARVWDVRTGHLRCGTFRHAKGITDACLSPDERWLVASSADWNLYLWEFTAAPAKRPDWLPLLAEAVSGLRLDAQRKVQHVSPELFLELRGRLSGTPTNEPAGKWVRWFLADRSTRTTSPHGRQDMLATTGGWAYTPYETLIPGTLPRLWRALAFLPDSPVVLQNLARALLAGPASPDTTALAQADWLSRCALERGPMYAASWWARAVYFERVGRLEDAIQAMNRAVELAPYGLHLWRALGGLLEKAGRGDEALAASTRSLDLIKADRSLDPARQQRYLLDQAALLERQGRPDEARRERLEAWRIPPRDTTTPRHLLNLDLCYNAGLDLPWVHDRNSGYHLAALPRGPQVLGEVGFDVRGLVQLSGATLKLDDPEYPERVDGIVVGQPARRLHFLHGTTEEAPPGTLVGRYLVHTADGARCEIPIRYGQDLLACHADLPLGATSPVVAWTGANRMYPVIRLFRTTWENPAPTIEITRIDFVSTLTRAAPFLVAITVDPPP